MKKILALVLVLALTLGCTAALADTYGLGVQTALSSSASATDEKDGTAEADVTICALVVDDEGKIVSCIFDVVQATVGFDAAGQITSDLMAEVLTKQEKGADYGMVVASAIGKEWNEQADALAAYCVGKTLDEAIAGIAEENGHATGADVVSGCTMGVTDLVKALEKAYAAATAE